MICKRCSKSFEYLKAGRKLYCSYECKWRFKYESSPKKSKSRVCRNCSVEFTDISKTNQLKYCSEECHLYYPYKVKYGLSKNDYKLLKDAHPVCRICKNINSNGAELSVDHCHSTGKIRGMLCQKCNQALGGFQDNEILLQRAITYLKETR